MATTSYPDALVSIIPDVLYSLDAIISKAIDAGAPRSDDGTQGALLVAKSMEKGVGYVQDTLNLGIEGVSAEVLDALGDSIECCRLLASALSPAGLSKDEKDKARSTNKAIAMARRVLASMEVLCDVAHLKGSSGKESSVKQRRIRKCIQAISEDYQSLTLLLYDRAKENRQIVCPRFQKPRTAFCPVHSVPSRLGSKLRETGASLEKLSCVGLESRESRRSRSIDRQIRRGQLQPWTRSDCIMTTDVLQNRGLFKPSLVALTCDDKQKHLTALRRKVVWYIYTLVNSVKYKDPPPYMPEEARLLAADLGDRLGREAEALTDVELGLFEFLWTFEAFRSIANERDDGSWADNGPLLSSVLGKVRQIMRDDDYVLTVNDATLALENVAFHQAINLSYGGRQISIADPRGHPSWKRQWRQRLGRTPTFIAVYDLMSYDTVYSDQGLKVFGNFLHYFGYIAKEPGSRNTTFLLYLVNVTKFRDKVKHVPQTADWASGYSGGNDPDEVAAYIVREFSSRVQGRHRVRVRMCDHMDPQNVDFLFASVDHAIRQRQILQRLRGYNSAAENT